MSNGNEQGPGSHDDDRDEVNRTPGHDTDPATGPITPQPHPEGSSTAGSAGGRSAPPAYYPPSSPTGGHPDPVSPYSTTHPYDPYAGTPVQPQRSRTGGRARLAAAAVALVVVAGGVGGGVATLLEHPTPTVATSSPSGAATASQPIAQAPNGSVETVAAKVLPSVVQIRVSVGGSGDVGSGVVLSTDGNILTNNHVVAGAAGAPTGAITVAFQDGTTATATIVGRDPSADLAVIKVDKTGLTPIAIGSSSALAVGQDVVAVGSPLGLSGTVTTGIVSALNRPVSASGQSTATTQASVIDAIQTDAAINPGNSGGALVNMNGELIGINSAIASLGQSQSGAQSGSIGLGFAIPVDHAQRIAQELISTGHATQSVLGVSTSTPPGTRGAQVANVVAGSPAASAGLTTGDVITKVDTQLIDTSDALAAAVRSHNPGDTITLTITDQGGTSRTTTATLGSQTITTS
ncbi:trypsin-like peptidase domain-containing protein [Rhodococcus antarcticus]|uniref:Trypsin-like peptidase domain-containing protein n=1 Tax=Rhodococcus antarcticus TaxID=2987751 RepID=A0ABY6P2F9_9NOCA|nr:trypsin-like peptidase domain-containing protein [Rhodococcus antarcticus]UZJ25521.1 trypsin-like peptidase domain-containing protein [Rhodococcus antarcticus]